jgi:hypothetical protein
MRNTWNFLKCDAGEGWRKSVGPIMWETKKCCEESRSRGTSYNNKRRKANWNGHILRRNCLLKQFIVGKTEWKGRIDERTREKT